MLISADCIFAMIMLGLPVGIGIVALITSIPAKPRKILGVLALVVTSALAGYSICGKNSILPKPGHNRVENVTVFYEDEVEVKDPNTKEVYRIQFSPLSVGHSIRRFYDVPSDQPSYVTYDSNFLAYGNVEFHMPEGADESEAPE